MHSNYGGGVSEMQQFMMDGCPSSLFSISTSPPPPPPPQNSNSGTSEVQKFHPLQHHIQQPLPPPMPQHFAHFGQPIPITQQLFQQSHHPHVHHHHQFQLFQQQQQQQQQQQHMGLDQESGPENSNSPARMMGGGGGGGGPSFLAAMNFKLGVNESSGGGGGSRDGINEDEGILQGDDDGSESRLHHHHHQDRQPWHREEESAANIKEPFWRPLDIDFINPNNKRPAKDKQPAAATTAEISSSSSIKHFKKSSDVSGCGAAATDSNYKLFSELEAIYKPGGGGGGGGGGGETNNNQTGSGSALTGDDNPLVPVTAPGPAAEHGQTDNVSDTSNADGAPQKKAQRDESYSGDAAARRKRGRKRRQQKQLGSIATFFESLVKQLMDHQESLHRKFLDVMEKKDQERGAREDACRKQEAAKAGREAAARAQERALAATREAAIISFLEKISGESLNLPTKAQFHSQLITEEESQQKDNNEDNAVEVYNADSANTNNNNNNSGGGGLMQFNSSRWPKAEVQALIRVRSGFEAKFQEPGLKGPLWEEVSLAMAAMGYQRSAKRCKEKWENINKYFRKTKDSGKKRPQHSKTCPYFHQLDQLYSKTPSLPNADHGRMEKNSELLDAIVVSNDQAKRNEQEGNEEEGQGESQDQEENADDDDDGDRSPVRMERNQEHNSSDHRLLSRLNS